MLGLSYAARSVRADGWSCTSTVLCHIYTLVNLNVVVIIIINFLCSIRVGNELGAGHPKVARFSVIVVTAAAIAFSVLATLAVLILRYPLSTLYTSSATVIEAVISLMPLMAISVFLNGIQPILSGTERGNPWITKPDSYSCYSKIKPYDMIIT